MMDKKEFVYSVGEVFGRVLDEEGLSRYYIGPYQRGYKWASEREDDQVPQLLKDVQKAWEKKKEGDERGEGEYFLQYVTVLKSNLADVRGYEDVARLADGGDVAGGAADADRVYEVIDGQQRLTTLAIVFDRLHRLCPEIESIGRRENGRDRIEYARDESGYGLFEKIEAIDGGGELEDTQDMFYISAAVRWIDGFFEKMAEDEVRGYAEFLRDGVKIILNRESGSVSAEEVFVNLNWNCVELTNTYLIKGLLLTRGVNTEDKNGDAYGYFNIMEQRKVNGRVWDEIQNWVEQPDVARFFFGEDERGMENLLMLLMAKDEGVCKDESACEDMEGGRRLFNRYNEVVATDEKGLLWMERLQHCYRKCRSWYEDAEVYNLMGYVLFLQGGNQSEKKKRKRMEILCECLKKSNKEMLKVLAEKALEIMPNLQQEGDPSYGNEKLTPLLLSLNVFHGWGNDCDSKKNDLKKNDCDGSKNMPRFNFPDYDRSTWTLEHIRPQNPKESLTLPKEAKDMVLKMYEKKNGKKVKEEVKQQIKDGKIENVEEVLPFLYSDLTDKQENKEDSMGNMALLPHSVNSSFSNNPYLIKRILIFRKVSEGAFIPPHTMAVFTKAINGKQLSVDLVNWDKDDVEAHEEWMRDRNKQIRAVLEKYKSGKKNTDKER